MPQIRLTGHLDVPPDAWERVLGALPSHVAASRAEPGCLRFQVTPDAKAGRLLVEEEFDSRASFDAHQARMASSPWAQITKGLKRHYQITEIPE